MKNLKHFIGIFIITFSVNVQSQSLTINLLGGPGFTYLSNSNLAHTLGTTNTISTTDSHAGCFGISLTDSISTFFGFNPGVIYSGHNQQYSGRDNSGNTFNSEIKIRYLDVPLLLRMGESYGFYFEIGPQFSFMLSAAEDATVNNSQVEINKDYSTDFTFFSFAAIAGVGVNMNVSYTTTFNLGFRYGYGLSDVIDETSTLSSHSLPFIIAKGSNANGTSYAGTRRTFISLLGSLNFAIK